MSNIVFQNLELHGRELRWKYKKPFDSMASLQKIYLAGVGGRVSGRKFQPKNYLNTLIAYIIRNMDIKIITAQIDLMLGEFEKAKRASPHHDLSGGLASDQMRTIYTRMRAAIERLAPVGSSYLRDAEQVEGHDGKIIIAYAGILRAIKDDYTAGYLQTVEDLIQAGVFENFLEMADELLLKKYKDASAVIAGTTLEEHIRKLANNANISTLDAKLKKRKFDELAVDLVKVNVFSETQRKILTAWYGIRNDAAHGNYANVIEGDVKNMIQGIREFMIRVPA